MAPRAGEARTRPGSVAADGTVSEVLSKGDAKPALIETDAL